MKFLTTSFLAIALLFNFSANAQCPAPPKLTLNSQAEVDAFPANYPGCTMIPSNVDLIVSGNDITNLDSLKQLVSVEGTFDIKNSAILSDITGLINLTTVGQLDIERCPQLNSLDGLQNLTTVTDDLEFSNMDGLTDISQLSGLTSIGGDVQINDCDALVTLAGFDNIASIGGDLIIKESANLTDLTALSNLTTVGGSVKILANKNLPNLDGLGNITSIGGGIDVKNNNSLSDCLGSCSMLDALVPPNNAFFSNNFPGSHCNDILVLEGDCAIFLPVELVDFRAKEDKKNASVVLTWNTVSEINNKHFEVQRSADGRVFKTVGIVKGNGTSTKTISYKFVDAQPIATAYYRLKQVDFAGDYSYTDIVLVELTKAQTAEVAAYPTVAKNEITLRFKGFESQSGTFNVFNAQGRLVYSEEVDLSNKMAYKSLNVAKFNNGIYTIVISDNANNITTNFVVVK